MFLIIFLFLFGNTSYAKTMVEGIPYCSSGGLLIEDIDQDMRKETICIKESGKTYDGYKEKNLVINFSKSGEVVVFGFYRGNDAYFDVVSISGNLRIKHAGRMGIRIDAPEKSSVIVYWDKKDNLIKRLWVSD